MAGGDKIIQSFHPLQHSYKQLKTNSCNRTHFTTLMTVFMTINKIIDKTRRTLRNVSRSKPHINEDSVISAHNPEVKWAIHHCTSGFLLATQHAWNKPWPPAHMLSKLVQYSIIYRDGLMSLPKATLQETEHRKKEARPPSPALKRQTRNSMWFQQTSGCHWLLTAWGPTLIIQRPVLLGDP